jgi:hypothetical protein
MDYAPGESPVGLYGGNSNWRGPIWIPMNYLVIEALERYFDFYGDEIKVECPKKSGRWLNLKEVALEINMRITKLFSQNSQLLIPDWKGLITFYEYFHGDTGQGLGASHQTGWTALIIECFEKVSRQRRSMTDFDVHRPSAA